MAIKYDEASQARRPRELKEVETGAESVAITVELTAARKQPIDLLAITIVSRFVETSSVPVDVPPCSECRRLEPGSSSPS